MSGRITVEVEGEDEQVVAEGNQQLTSHHAIERNRTL